MKLANNKINQIINSIKSDDNFCRAFTHSSYCNQHNLSLDKSYEVLEFVGDGILGFHVSRYIYLNFPNYNEGQMSKLKQLMVQEKTLALLSESIGLVDYLRLSDSEKKNKGTQKKSILSDIFEAFLAALYLVKGNKSVDYFLRLTLFAWIRGKEKLIWDYKSQLQEYCQARKNSVQYLKLEEKTTNGNEKIFVVEVSDKLQTFSVQGVGKNIKSAEQEAAEKVLKDVLHLVL